MANLSQNWDYEGRHVGGSLVAFLVAEVLGASRVKAERVVEAADLVVVEGGRSAALDSTWVHGP